MVGKSIKQINMILETKYNPGDTVYFTIGTNDKVKIVTSTIESIVCIVAAISGNTITYNCQVNREDTDTVVKGMPLIYTVEKTENNIYETLELCVESISKKRK
jgi:hypothetical protein